MISTPMAEWCFLICLQLVKRKSLSLKDPISYVVAHLFCFILTDIALFLCKGGKFVVPVSPSPFPMAWVCEDTNSSKIFREAPFLSDPVSSPSFAGVVVSLSITRPHTYIPGFLGAFKTSRTIVLDSMDFDDLPQFFMHL